MFFLPRTAALADLSHARRRFCPLFDFFLTIRRDNSSLFLLWFALAGAEENAALCSLFNDQLLKGYGPVPRLPVRRRKSVRSLPPLGWSCGLWLRGPINFLLLQNPVGRFRQVPGQRHAAF